MLVYRRQFYMPPFHMITKDHLKDVLQEKKAFLKISEVRFCNAPAFDEIGVKALYERVIKLPNMAQYFPDAMPKGRAMFRSYMYNVWNTIHPEQVKEVIQHANRQRYAVTSEKVQEESIIISEAWKKELDSLPFISKQKGRMSALSK